MLRCVQFLEPQLWCLAHVAVDREFVKWIQNRPPLRRPALARNGTGRGARPLHATRSSARRPMDGRQTICRSAHRVEEPRKSCSQSSRVRFGGLAVFDRRETHGSFVDAVAGNGRATSKLKPTFRSREDVRFDDKKRDSVQGNTGSATIATTKQDASGTVTRRKRTRQSKGNRERRVEINRVTPHLPTFLASGDDARLVAKRVQQKGIEKKARGAPMA